MSGSRPFRAVGAVLALALAVSLNLRLDARARAQPPRHTLYFPSGKFLRLASLGSHSLAADLLYIWSIQYYSTERGERWRYLEELFERIGVLDPRFVVAYSMGALILAIEAGDRRAALRLLDQGIAANPSTYLLAFEAGFYARELGDHELASQYFAVARLKPDAPSFVGRWYYYTLGRTGRNLEALALWQEALADARNDYERQVAERYVRELTLRIELEALAQAVRNFRARVGRNPVALEELVKAGDLGDLPLDPYGEAFHYDRSTGEVSSASSFLSRQRVAP